MYANVESFKVLREKSITKSSGKNKKALGIAAF